MWMRPFVKPWARYIGIEDHLKNLVVESRMMGERLKFLLQGQPSASQALLLVGSGRSGTTWICDLIAAAPHIQQIFEPLHPETSVEVQQLIGWKVNEEAHIRPYYLRPSEIYPNWHSFLERLLTGQVRNYSTDFKRTSYWPDQFLIKLIRGNLMLGYIYDNFQPQIIYVIRHPCAVVHSRLKIPWHADTKDILKQEALVEDYLRPWIGDIEKEKDLLGAHAVWWAVENMVAMRELGTRPHYAVTYETLCLEPEDQIHQIYAWAGISKLPTSLDDIVERPSQTSSFSGMSYDSTMDRLSSWQRKLSSTDQHRVLDWVDKLGVTLYNEHPLPTALQEKA